MNPTLIRTDSAASSDPNPAVTTLPGSVPGDSGHPAQVDDGGAVETPLGAVRRAYRQVAPVYDFVFGKVLEPGRRALVAAAMAHGPTSLLEVGVGSGLTLPLYPADVAVTGIDLSPDMLKLAEQRAARLPGRRIDLQLMNAEQMRFADASFDCVTVPYTLSVTPDTPGLVREIRRVCKPGGTIVVVNHFTRGRIWPVVDDLARPLLRRVGVNKAFRYEEHILGYDWDVVAVRPVNVFGVSLLVEIRNRSR